MTIPAITSSDASFNLETFSVSGTKILVKSTFFSPGPNEIWYLSLNDGVSFSVLNMGAKGIGGAANSGFDVTLTGDRIIAISNISGQMRVSVSPNDGSTFTTAPIPPQVTLANGVRYKAFR